MSRVVSRSPSDRWHVRLLGGLELADGHTTLHRLPSRAVAALLARLALWPERMHAREELVELLWPGVELAVGRNRLRQALSTLKSLLETPAHGAVLQADRLGVRVVGGESGALGCDVREFEAELRAGRRSAAARLYRGPLLPGFYDDWIAEERLRLEALADRLAAEAPAVPGRNRLPAYLTRYVGGDAQAAALRDAVIADRMVTLTGPGGAGKTRLAVETAQSLHDRFDLVAFVPLAACNDGAAMLDALLATLHVRGSGSTIERLAQSVQGRRALLVLDNVEQLLPQAAEIIAALAAAAPALHLLATSRRLLGLDGEREFRVAPLALPAAGAGTDEAAASPAVSLFVDRARAARADFHLGPRNAGALCALVHVLEGMPLAIELAASRVRSLTPAEMLERLRGGSSLDLLQRGGPRTGFDARHASMERVIAWSWDLLAPPHAALLAALTVFEGGFTAAAAAWVCDAADVALAIDELLGHSMLHARELADGSLRFAIYEPIREFAAARLAPGRAAALRRRHRAWWPRWADGFGTTPPLAALRAELANIDAALAGALADGAPDDALRIVLALRAALNDVSLPARSLARVEAALAASADAALRSAVAVIAGIQSFDAGRREAAQAHLEAAIALAPPASALRARALQAAAAADWRGRRDPAPVLARLDEAQALAVAHGELEVQASVCALRAFVANTHDHDYARGEALHRQALALWERLGSEHAVMSGIYNLAICAFNARRWTEALQRLDAVCEHARANEDWQQLGAALNVRGNTLAALRDWPRALAAYRECVDVAWAAVEPYTLAYGFWNAPRALAHVQRPADAARLMGFAVAYWTGHFGPLSAGDRFDVRRVRRLAAAALGNAETQAAFDDGARLSLADAVALLRRAA
jgi:predicted ATPase